MAMVIEGDQLFFGTPEKAPALHFRIRTEQEGDYKVWMLLRFADDRSDSCYLGLDGVIQDPGQQYSGGNLFLYSMKQRWNWQLMTLFHIEKGEHIFSVYGRKSGLFVDRIFLTRDEGLPPDDGDWEEI